MVRWIPIRSASHSARFIFLQSRRFSKTAFSEMKTVGVVSGGKDSIFNLHKCVAEGHDLVALANLYPKSPVEMDSYMYQSAGHELVPAVAEALGLPLYRRPITGAAVDTGMAYHCSPGDEVEDLYELIKTVKESHAIEAVAVGAVLSDYQRIRVESVCSRLGLTCLAYLWSCDQSELFEEIKNCGIEAILVKVACLGLDPQKHLGKTILELSDHLTNLNSAYGAHMCGEGGEYETITLDCPLYNKKIILDDWEVVMHSQSNISPVGYLAIKRFHLEEKAFEVASIPWSNRVSSLPIKTSASFTRQYLDKYPPSPAVAYVKQANLVSCTEVWPEEYQSFSHRSGDTLFCSVVGESKGDVAGDTTALMSKLGDILAAAGMSSADIKYSLLYVSDMGQFANINAQYTKFFSANPPPRICVEGVLPRGSLLHAQILCSKEPKDTRHVQSISHWAPSAIGPYSQAAKVGNMVYVSGQIPFIPGSMKAIAAGFEVQCHLAMDHVFTVATAMSVGLDHIAAATCYVVREQDMKTCLEIAKTRLPPKVNAVCVLVPRLPRDVLAEWHMTFDSSGATLPLFAGSGSTMADAVDAISRNSPHEGTFFLFFNATCLDAGSLLSAMAKGRPAVTFIPIPVARVVCGLDQLERPLTLVCSTVPGF